MNKSIFYYITYYFGNIAYYYSQLGIGRGCVHREDNNPNNDLLFFHHDGNLIVIGTKWKNFFCNDELINKINKHIIDDINIINKIIETEFFYTLDNLADILRFKHINNNDLKIFIGNIESVDLFLIYENNDVDDKRSYIYK